MDSLRDFTVNVRGLHILALTSMYCTGAKQKERKKGGKIGKERVLSAVLPNPPPF